MDDHDQTGSPDKASEISAALDRLWVRFLPETRSRVGVLEDAALALTNETITPAQRESAAGAAHKLAGTLGTFSLARGTVVARELERLYTQGEGPSPETAAQMAAELREMVEGRSAPQSD